MPRLYLVAAIIACLVPGVPAHACRAPAELRLDDIRYASTVVVGRIVNYRLIRDEAFRRKILASPRLSRAQRKFYKAPDSLLTVDYARFGIVVDEVLAGRAAGTIAVTWGSPTLGGPSGMASGRFLIALRDPASPIPPIRGPSATVLPARDPKSLTVLQAPCSGPFIFGAGSAEAREVRTILSASSR